MLTSSKQLIHEAWKNGYAVGSFNTSDLEITKAIISAAENLKSPVIIGTSERAIGYAGLDNLASIVKEAAKKAKVPVALHLDHGRSLAIVSECLKVGYTSVMFDASHLSYDENKILTKQAVNLAHAKDIPCEGELGSVGKAGRALKEIKKGFTDPKLVAEFVRETGVDFLAISCGSSHGNAGEEKLDIPLVKKINNVSKVPLVLHGGSGIPDEDIQEAIANGIAKINIDTDIRHGFSRAVKEAIEARLDDPRDIMTKAMEEVQKIVEAKITIFGSAGRA